MLKVYICEDDKSQRDQYSKIIQDIIAIENLDFKVEMISEDPRKVLEHVKNVKGQGSGIYFLDIELKVDDLNGIILAQEIRKYDPRGFVVFVTTHSEMTLLTFKYNVEAMDYIIKDITKDNIKNIKEKFRTVQANKISQSQVLKMRKTITNSAKLW